MKRSKFPYIVLIPLLSVMFLFIMVPILGSVVISFMDYNPLRADGAGNMFVGLKNYVRLFGDHIFLKTLSNTLYFVVVMTVINLVFTLLVAQLLVGLRSARWRSLFRVTFFLPCVASLSVVAVVWSKALFPVKGGLLNMGLGLLGIPAVNWVDADHIMNSMILLSLWADVGYNIILFISGIEGIPTSYMEAAEIDGAGPIRRFLSITFPLLNRTFTFVLLMTLISYFQVFVQFQIIAKGGGQDYAAYMMSTFIYSMGFGNKEMGYASAGAMIMFIIIMAFTLVQQKLNKVDWGYE